MGVVDPSTNEAAGAPRMETGARDRLRKLWHLEAHVRELQLERGAALCFAGSGPRAPESRAERLVVRWRQRRIVIADVPPVCCAWWRDRARRMPNEFAIFNNPRLHRPRPPPLCRNDWCAAALRGGAQDPRTHGIPQRSRLQSGVYGRSGRNAEGSECMKGCLLILKRTLSIDVEVSKKSSGRVEGAWGGGGG